MKVAILLLAYGRDELTQKVLAHNLKYCGISSIEYVVYTIKEKGIAYALNVGIETAMKEYAYDYYMFLANDIYEPKDWLRKRLEFAIVFSSAGLISIPPDKEREKLEFTDVIGNYLIPKKVIEKVGYFTEEFGEYGPIDLDYNHRVKLSGFKSFYLPNMFATHLGPDDLLYGYSKIERVQKAWSKHVEDVYGYHAGLKELYYAPKWITNSKNDGGIDGVL